MRKLTSERLRLGRSQTANDDDTTSKDNEKLFRGKFLARHYLFRSRNGLMLLQVLVIVAVVTHTSPLYGTPQKPSVTALWAIGRVGSLLTAN